jgi:HPt (histidine-containing phosphotransfer) domain-containing protein
LIISAEDSDTVKDCFEFVGSVAEAMSALERFSFDGIVVDMNATGDEGLDLVTLVRNVRFAGTGSNVPVIAFSNICKIPETDEFRAAGVDEFAVGNFDHALIGAILNKIRNLNMMGKSVENSKQIDSDAVKSRLECDDNFLVEIWDAFQEEAQQLNSELSRAIAAGNLPLIERHAHTFKGMSGNIGAEKLRAIAFEMEKAAKGGEMQEILDIYPVMLETINLVIAEIGELTSAH